MQLSDMRKQLGALATDVTLEEEVNLLARTEAFDFIAFVEETVRFQRRSLSKGMVEELTGLAASLKQRLKVIDGRLFERFRERIRSGDWRGDELRRHLEPFIEPSSDECFTIYHRYDGLDALISGVFRLTPFPERETALQEGMVHCQMTPARTVLDMLDALNLTPQDVLYDLGSGLGQIPVLVNLLTGVRTRGVEYEPVYCDFACRLVDEFGLDDVRFVLADARDADYTDGTVFFLFTPFTGQLLEAVLERLQAEVCTRRIHLCTLGSCTTVVAEQAWLELLDPEANHPYRLAIFRSGGSKADR